MADSLLFEDLHRRVKEIQPMVFEGIKLGLNRPLSPHFQVSHNMAMGMMGSSYTFGANYMGTKQVSPSESYPLIASDFQCDGTMNFNFIHKLGDRWKSKLVGSFTPTSCAGSQVSLDYKGNNFTSTLTAANIDLIKNSGILVGQYLHRFSENLSVGPELLLQYCQQNADLRMMSQLSLGGRFNGDKYHVDATLTLTGAHLSYCHKAQENLNFGVEFMTDSSYKQTNAGFCFQYDLTKAHTTFKGSIDTAWHVGAVLEKRLYPLPIALSLSAVLNHPKNSTSVGVGLTIG